MMNIDERTAKGTAAQAAAPLSAHAGWVPAPDRASPVDLLEEQETTREPDLVPVRHGRMMVSPFTFYRGAAKIMAEDLKDTPTAGLGVQLCGDAHLSNFGAFASPERRLVFDLNDFDETLPGPFEYDVKRMAVSFVLAARDNGFSRAEAQAAAQASVAAYREAMAGFAKQNTMAIWYASLDEAEITRVTHLAAESAEASEKAARKAAAEKAGAGKAARAASPPRARRRTRQKAPRRARRKARQRARRRRMTPARNRRSRRRRWPGSRRSGSRSSAPRPAPATASRRCPSSPRWSTAGTGSSASRRSSSRCVTWRRSCPLSRPTTCSASSSAPTGRPCSPTASTCSSSSRSWTSRARSWAWAAWAPGRSSPCCRGATARTRCSCRPRRRRPRSSRRTCRAAGTASTASAWCRDSG